MEPWEEELHGRLHRDFQDMEERLAQTAAVSREIGGSLLGLSADEAARRLTAELRARGFEPDDALVASVARTLSAGPFPLWPPGARRARIEQEDERIRLHDEAVEAEERERLVELWGEQEAESLLAGEPETDAVGDAVSEVMERLDGACAYTVVPPDSHDGRRHLVLIRPYSRRIAERIQQKVAAIGAEAEVREYADDGRPPWL